MSDTRAATSRHASWLELFFDLVVVAAVAAVLAHLVPAAVVVVVLLIGAVVQVWNLRPSPITEPV
jgi:low temperature requirement protein LtrA